MSSSINSILKKEAHNYETISVSYHEAGHTIYALLQYFKVSSVKVFLDKNIGRIVGETNYNGTNFDDIEEDTLRYGCINSDVGISYSGIIAEKYYYKSITGDSRFPSYMYDAFLDIKSSSGLIVKYNVAPPGKARASYKMRIIKEVSKKIEEHWGDVTLIAHALFQRKKLNFDDLQDILTKKSNDRDFWKERFKDICDLDKQIAT